MSTNLKVNSKAWWGKIEQVKVNLQKADKIGMALIGFCERKRFAKVETLFAMQIICEMLQAELQFVPYRIEEKKGGDENNGYV